MQFGITILLVTAITGTLPERNGEAIHVRNSQELQQALARSGSGDTILLEDGTYKMESSLWIENKENLTIKGASEDPAKVILMGGGWDGGDPKDVVVIRGSGDIAIAYLTITEARSYGIKIEGVRNLRNPWDINISHCRFIDIGTRAVKGTATQDRKHMERGSVRHCYFENTRVPDPGWLFKGDYISAIDMMYLDHWTFADNVFKNIKGANGGGRGAIFVWNQSRNVLVERNLFMNCDRSIAFGNPSEPTNYVQGTLHNYDGIIRSNAIVGGADKGIELVWLDNVKVYNNTVYCPNPQRRAIHYFQRINRLHLANNLVRGRMEGEGDVILENNVVGLLDNYFVDPEAGDLHLTEAATLALGKGIALPLVQDDIDGEERGEHPDVGADERR
jgi:pectate lyase